MSKKYSFLEKLEDKIETAKNNPFATNRHKRKLALGTAQIAKKMGEEAVEMVIASGRDSDEDFLEEAADVLYYYLIALHNRGFEFSDVLEILKTRNKNGKKCKT